MIEPGARVAILGRSGSGKSVLLRQLLAPYHRAILLDPKRRADFGGWAIVEGARDLRRDWPRHHARVIARPSLADTERDWLDACATLAYYGGSLALGVDELAGIVTEQRSVRGLDICLQRGRDPGPQGPVTTIVASQRPKRIPVNVLTEADHLFAFDLNHPDDRKLIADVTGHYDRPRVRHGFWYWSPELDGPIECAPLAIRRAPGTPDAYPSSPIPGTREVDTPAENGAP